MIHVYYGMGKGKTSTINGSAVRAIGAGLRVGLFRFLKGIKTNEDEVLAKIGVKIVSLHPSEKFVIQMNNEEKANTKMMVDKTLEIARKSQNDFDLMILDEFLDLSHKTVGLLSEEDQLKFLDSLSCKYIMITGHDKIDSIWKKADLITFFNNEKHYYDKGQKAIFGIDF